LRRLDIGYTVADLDVVKSCFNQMLSHVSLTTKRDISAVDPG